MHENTNRDTQIPICRYKVTRYSGYFQVYKKYVYQLVLILKNDVVITSRSHGSYRLVPVRESDTLIDQTTLEAKIRRGIEEYEQGKVHKMEEGESVDGLPRLVSRI